MYIEFKKILIEYSIQNNNRLIMFTLYTHIDLQLKKKFNSIGRYFCFFIHSLA